MAKYKTTVGTSINRVIEDDQLPGSIKTGIIKSLLENGDIVDHVLEELTTSIGLRAERMYEYAKNGDYPWGLPSGQFTNGETGRDEVEDVLSTLEGSVITLDYVHHGSANSLHLGWMQLISEHGYDPATNQLGDLTTSLGTTVWLKDMQVVIPAAEADTIDPKTLEQWGIAAKAGYTPQRTLGTPTTRALIKPTPVQLDASTSIEYLKVIHVRLVSGVVTEGVFTIPLPITGYADDEDEDRDYFHARYVVGGVVKYWIYEDGLGTYPTLDGLFDKAPEINGVFFPFIYFRYNKESEVDDTGTESYRTSKRMAKYLGMDYDVVGEGINENPDIDDVENAILMFAIPGVTTNELERRYLFEFFDNMFFANPTVNRYELETSIDIADKQTNELYLAAPGLVVQDTRFKMAVRNDRIFKRRIPGNIGPVGSHDSGYVANTKSIVAIDLATGIPTTIDTPRNYHYYRRQISSTIYEEIQVVDLRTVFYVFNQYKVIGDDTDKILLIPVDRSITASWSIPDRETLYARSLHYVFNSRVVTKVKWYETGLFKAVMIIVSIVITIYTLGGGIGAVAALLAAGNYTAAALIVIQGFLQLILVSIAFNLFVKVVGFKAAFVIAILAAVAGAVSYFDVAGLPGTPFASDLLQVASGLSKAVQDVLGAEIQDLYNQAREFDVWKDSQLKVLETAQDLLNNNSYLSPFVIFGEKPDDFYNRTVHSGNIGVVGGIDCISTFVESKLTLPKLQDSLFEGY